MTRPWQLWSAFALSLTLLAGAMTWITISSREAAEVEIRNRAQAIQDREIDLALWRMEAELNRIIGRESRRDHAAYFAFHPVFSVNDRVGIAVNRDPTLLIPSRLLVDRPSEVRLYFLFDDTKTIRSPQCPQGHRARFASDNFTPSIGFNEAKHRLEELGRHLSWEALDARLPVESFDSDPAVMAAKAQFPLFAQETASPHANPNALREWNARRKAFGNAAQRRAPSIDVQNFLRNSSPALAPPLFAREGALRSLWIGENLLLARRVWADGRMLLEGAWLDWPALRVRLHDMVSDLAPGVALVPIIPGKDDPNAPFRLASIPARLQPGPLPIDAVAPLPLHDSVIMGWIGLAALALVIGLLLAQVLSLSERRAAFVSSVTHEMRTPLTTFRLYAELLRSGRITVPEKRQRYLETLGREADRLGQLVENVLSYARIENRKGPQATETIALGDLLGRCSGRLKSRSLQAEMVLRIDLPQGIESFNIETNAEVVEQILFNLVDNAAKYGGGPGSCINIVVRGRSSGSGVTLSVIDEGAGIDPALGRRLFRPFEKSDGARSPGLGLGLALSRRLAKGLGGSLRHIPTEGGGCTMVLTLPAPKGSASLPAEDLESDGEGRDAPGRDDSEGRQEIT